MPYGFEKAADSNGEVTTSFQQSTLIQKIQSDYKQADASVKHGLCMGFSSCWINQNSKGNSFWKWLDSGQSQGTLNVMAHRENNTLSSLLSVTGGILPSTISEQDKARLFKDQSTWASKWISQQGRLSASPRVEGKYNGETIFKELTKSEGFKLLSFQGRSQGSHAVAAFVKGNEITYMDPNAGEVKFADKFDFGWWFVSEHLKSYDFAKFDGFYIDSFPAPVNPYEAKQEYKKSASWARTLPSGSHSVVNSLSSAAKPSSTSVDMLNAMPNTSGQ